MKRASFSWIALAVLCSLAGPAAAEPTTPRSTGIAPLPRAALKLTASRRVQLEDTLNGLARQIAQIDANIANLGANNAAALRFRAVSLAAYRRAWAELTRGQVDFGDTAASETVAALTGARP